MAKVPRPLRDELSALRTRDNWRNFLYLGADWGLVLAAATACQATGSHPAAYLAAAVIIGSRQRALMNLVHQASHGKLFRSPALNQWGGKFLAAFPLLTSLSAYTCAHCRHHGSLWADQEDPKTVRYHELGLVSPMADGARRFWLRHMLAPLLLRHAPFNVRAALIPDGEPHRETAERALFWIVALPTLVLSGLGDEILLFWVVPFCTTFQAIRYFAEMAEHAGLRSDDPWMATRNWRGGTVARFLLSPHSDHYHLTHHLCPAVPHHRLASAHRILMHVPDYAAGHHCDGYFFRRSDRLPSVIEDIRHPERRTAVTAGSGEAKGAGHDAKGAGHDAEQRWFRGLRDHPRAAPSPSLADPSG